VIVPPSCLPVLEPSYRPLLPLTRAEPLSSSSVRSGCRSTLLFPRSSVLRQVQKRGRLACSFTVSGLLKSVLSSIKSSRCNLCFSFLVPRGAKKRARSRNTVISSCYSQVAASARHHLVGSCERVAYHVFWSSIKRAGEPKFKQMEVFPSGR
jgi:hypothetical protein